MDLTLSLLPPAVERNGSARVVRERRVRTVERRRSRAMERRVTPTLLHKAHFRPDESKENDLGEQFLQTTNAASKRTLVPICSRARYCVLLAGRRFSTLGWSADVERFERCSKKRVGIISQSDTCIDTCVTRGNAHTVTRACSCD